MIKSRKKVDLSLSKMVQKYYNNHEVFVQSF